MVRMKIKNFGPVKDGYKGSKDGFFDINMLTIFVGPQGSGKSTIVKLFSSFIWLEKAIITGKKNQKEIETHKFFKGLLAYQRLESFYSDDSEIEFIDDFIKIKVLNETIKYELLSEKKYVRPKIQYIPSERSLVSVISRYAQIPLLPDSMRDFVSVYDEAITDEEMQDSEIPIDNLKIRYNKKKNKTELYTKSYKVLLSDSSSGFQSAVPLFIVTKFFSDSIKKRRNEYKFKNLNEQKLFMNDLNNQIRKLMIDYSAKAIEPFYCLPGEGEPLYFNQSDDEPLYNEPKTIDNDKFKDFLNRKLNSCFYNIVEEPEQNLFPNSQKSIIQFLVSCLNGNPNNMLLLSTHSPYIVETINNSIYAASLMVKGLEVKELLDEKYHIPYDLLSAYVIRDGEIKSIKVDNIKQIDPAEIDRCSEEINTLYSKLLDLDYSYGN